MKNWGYVIKALREARNLTQFELAERTGLSRSKISLIELGRTKTYDDETIAAFSRGFDIPEPELRLKLHGGSGTKELLQTDYVRVKIIGIVPAGIPVTTEQQDLGYIPIESSKIGGLKLGNIFALKVSGNSLAGDGIEHGGTLVIEKDVPVIDGKIYVIRIGNEFAARHVYRKDGMIVLTSSNGSYQEIRTTEVEIVGRVVKFFPAGIDF